MKKLTVKLLKSTEYKSKKKIARPYQNFQLNPSTKNNNKFYKNNEIILIKDDHSPIMSSEVEGDLAIVHADLVAPHGPLGPVRSLPGQVGPGEEGRLIVAYEVAQGKT